MLPISDFTTSSLSLSFFYALRSAHATNRKNERIRNREKIFHVIIVLMCDSEAEIEAHDSHVVKY